VVVVYLAWEKLEAALGAKVKHGQVPAVFNDGKLALTWQELEAIVSFVAGRVRESR
jgi:hypothetical protein